MDLRLDAAKWLKRRGMRKLLKALGASDGLTRYVGGAVRDDLVGFPVSDIDLATRLRPPEVIERLDATNIKTIPTGIEHGMQSLEMSLSALVAQGLVSYDEAVAHSLFPQEVKRPAA